MPKNRFYRAAKISEDEFLTILEAFCNNVPATGAAVMVGVSVRSINDIYIRIRKRIYDKVMSDPYSFNGSKISLIESIVYRGYNSFFASNKRHPILMELLRCGSGEILDRISNRGIRLDNILIHSLEIYVQKKAKNSSPFEFSINSQKSYDNHVVKAVDDIVRNDTKSFKLNVNNIIPLERTTGSIETKRFYDEIISEIIETPI